MDDRLAPTIAAIATPPGPGGIGVIRISGPEALAILHRLFLPRKQTPFTPISHRMYYGWIRHPDSDQVIDEVLAVYMQAPHTYTREEVVEVHCHSNFIVLQEMLVAIQAAGARLAAAGEFTKRAFLNGRLDLSQAEAVLELLGARSRAGLRLAVNHLHGGLQRYVIELSEALLRLRALLEVAIDFPDEEVEIIDSRALRQTLEHEILPLLDSLIVAADNGKIFRDGVAAVIIGRPNVGKSSLLNALLREERAIVTTQAGTTRDTIEEYLTIGGLPVRIVDTAGIRAAGDPVEEMGIQRSRRKMAEADLVLLVVDAAEPLHEGDVELLAAAAETPLLVVANKCDLCRTTDVERLRGELPGRRLVAISAKNGTGIPALEEAIFTLVTGHGQEAPWEPELAAAPNARQRAALAATRDLCRRLRDELETALAPELLAIDLQEALDHLGEISGRTTTEDVLDRIFGEFCIGK